ncbi:MAG: GNAT family N-acetyltransferase [Saprospiraceae bacterium]|nr:GNAT family N-acetyltransferase [Saprospiraceae bacterium]MBP7699355.1 GNAT family N-acetyltransferase [Saprospiraceae bacterium]
MNYIIRQAERGDLPAIFELVKALAFYEREPESVTATIENYYDDFDAGIFAALVAEMDNEVVGMALYHFAYSTWRGRMMYLEDFYVLENKRRFGIGQQLFDVFLKVAKEQKCVLTKWQVLDWNTPAQQFYEKNNAILEKNWWNGKLFLH